MKPIITPATLRAILNTAPIVIQGAGKLIRAIKDRDSDNIEQSDDSPATIEGLRTDISRLEQRLDGNDESDVEQIKLIEQLARQNELLAASLEKACSRLDMVTAISIVAVIIGLAGIIMTSL